MKNCSFNFYDKCSDISRNRRILLLIFSGKIFWFIESFGVTNDLLMQYLLEYWEIQSKKIFFLFFNFSYFQRDDKDDRKPFNLQRLIISTWIWNILFDCWRSTEHMMTLSQQIFLFFFCYYIAKVRVNSSFFMQLFFFDANFFAAAFANLFKYDKKYFLLYLLLLFFHFRTKRTFLHIRNVWKDTFSFVLSYLLQSFRVDVVMWFKLCLISIFSEIKYIIRSFHVSLVENNHQICICLFFFHIYWDWDAFNVTSTKK